MPKADMTPHEAARSWAALAAAARSWAAVAARSRAAVAAARVQGAFSSTSPSTPARYCSSENTNEWLSFAFDSITSHFSKYLILWDSILRIGLGTGLLFVRTFYMFVCLLAVYVVIFVCFYLRFCAYLRTFVCSSTAYVCVLIYICLWAYLCMFLRLSTYVCELTYLCLCAYLCMFVSLST